MRGTYQTRQRRAVLEFLAQHAERQFTVDELLAAMGAAAPGRSTAYRLLDRLAEEGAVRRFLPEGTHTAAYQATATGHCDAHLHLKCVTCGKLIHLDETISDAVQGDLLRRAGIIEMNISWFSNGSSAMLAAVIANIWRGIPFFTISYMSALSGISDDLYESAKIDGANSAVTLFRITLPMITPTAFLVFVLAWINAFKIFKEVYFIAGAYPDYSVYTLQNYMNNMFGKLNYQLVTAAAYSFGLIVFALFGALFFLQRRAARGLN